VPGGFSPKDHAGERRKGLGAATILVREKGLTPRNRLLEGASRRKEKVTKPPGLKKPLNASLTVEESASDICQVGMPE